MDETDQKLIAALRRNARASVSDLSIELGVSRATVRSRMERLVKEGEILGFTIVVKSDANDMPVRGVTLIEIEGKGNERIISNLRGFPEIQAIHSTNGQWDLIVEFGTETLAKLDEALKRLRLIDGINNSETNLYLATHRSSHTSSARRS
ncbi:MAG: Lrp/AsnC family transcriptional regulator [Proteobacteria bacterium]|nr:Lrp/AsnC family transcriptional regulator [Pseudomonadota bacterium]